MQGKGREGGNTIVIWPLSILFFWTCFISPAFSNPPPLELLVSWECAEDTAFLNSIRSDSTVCCTFSFRTQKSSTLAFSVRTSDGIDLGFVYGKMNSLFLQEITPDLLALAQDLRDKLFSQPDVPVEFHSHLKPFD